MPDNKRLGAMFNLAAELPRILPEAIAWAEAAAAAAQRYGLPLNASGIRLAQAVGVQCADSIRLVEGFELPFPADPELSLAATQTGLLGPHMAGLTLGYAVFIRRRYALARVISHECRHV
ncbi:MAG: hypothetical protein U0V70_16765, partial [Terriglobia bacterium]